MWVCGTIILFCGFYLFSDTNRILLSRLLGATNEQLADLPQPLFYYISLGLGAAGTIAILAAIVGFWASCLNTYCFLTLYFLTTVILLLLESAACLAITIWPQCLGLNLDETKMVKAMQGSYGVPGREQFTIAMDLAQVHFRCCGINSDINYDTSLWRLQSYGQRDWTVPLTCCKLQNKNERFAYLDPKPLNGSLCQALQKFDYELARHTESCLNKIDAWYREQHVLFLGGSLIVSIVEFCVLLAIILNCTRMPRKASCREDQIELHSTHRNQRGIPSIENVYETDLGSIPTEIKEVYIQPPDLCKNRHNTTFKPKGNQYQISKSYLV